MIHVTAPVVVAYGVVGIKLWWLANLLDSASRWSVPLFVMISGAFLLDPRVPRPLPQFLKRRLAKIIAPLIFWCSLYYVWLSWWDRAPVDWAYIAKGTLAGVPYTHLYFLFLIFGLYLITPMLRVYVMHASRRNLAYCLLVLFGAGTLNSYIASWWDVGGGLNATSQFVPFIGYYLAGYYLKALVLGQSARRWAGVGVIVLTLVTAVGTYLLSRDHGINSGVFLYGYNSITVIPTSLLLFAWFNSVEPNLMARRITHRYRTIIRTLSAATFGIYLIHPLVLDGLASFGIAATGLRPPVGLLSTYTLALALSIVVTVSMQQIPWVRRLVP